MLLLGSNPNADASAVLTKVGKSWDYDVASITPGHAWMFSSGDVDFCNDLSIRRETTIVHDIDNNDTPILENSEARWLVVSSPNSKKLKPVDSYPNWVRLYMPQCTLEDLQLALEVCYPSSVDAAVVEARFKSMSGIARYVVEAEQGVSESIQRVQIRNISLNSLKIMSITDFTQLPASAPKQAWGPEVSANYMDFTFKVVPSANYRTFTIRFMSDDVARAVAEGIVWHEREALGDFLYSSKNDGNHGGFRGHVLEALQGSSLAS